DRLAHHSPLSSTRPSRSVLPSPLRSAAWTSTQWTFGFHVIQKLVVKLVPLDSATAQAPPPTTRPTRSVRPSPLKSPGCTSAQVSAGSHVAHTDGVKASVPLEVATYHWPVPWSRPARLATRRTVKVNPCVALAATPLVAVRVRE